MLRKKLVCLTALAAALSLSAPTPALTLELPGFKTDLFSHFDFLHHDDHRYFADRDYGPRHHRGYRDWDDEDEWDEDEWEEDEDEWDEDERDEDEWDDDDRWDHRRHGRFDDDDDWDDDDRWERRDRDERWDRGERRPPRGWDRDDERRSPRFDNAPRPPKGWDRDDRRPRRDPWDD